MFFTVLVRHCSLVCYQRQRGGLSKLRACGTFFVGAFPLFAKKLLIDTTPFMAAPITPIPQLESNQEDIKTRMELMVLRVQAEFCKVLEDEDDCKKFVVDRRFRPNGGHITCLLHDGKVFEQAGVTISVIDSKLSADEVARIRSRGKSLRRGQVPYFAVGISGVVHPRNPLVPTVHFNYRYVEVRDGDEVVWWFGGGTDLIPCYMSTADAVHFHSVLKEVCDKHDKSYYLKFKKRCDEYFNIPHRGERRGIGGIVFDSLDAPDKEACFKFVTECAEAVIPSYVPLVQRHRHAICSESEKDWQMLRRGRYVEFNLLYDRGIEYKNYDSLLMSLPLLAKWEYVREPSKESPEGQLLEVLRNPKDWIEECSCSDDKNKDGFL